VKEDGMNNLFKIFCTLILLSACQTLNPTSVFDVQDWKGWEESRATQSLLNALSPSGTKTGVVIASPSTQDPDYFYHWQRDAALTMNVVVGLYEGAPAPDLKASYDKKIQDYISFTRELQKTKNPSGDANDFFLGYGEPKFNVDGSPFTEKWGRPQNDGPALQVLTLVRYIRASEVDGHSPALAQLYNRDAAKSLLKSNLEFLAHHWKDTSFDIWEEIRGHHFYTQLVQRRGLLEGAEVADEAKDPIAAKKYRTQASLLQREIEKHFVEPTKADQKKYILNTLDRDGGIDYQKSQLDASVLLAAQHARGSTRASLKDPYFSATDDRILVTAIALEKTFSKIYRINDAAIFPAAKKMGPAIGRYPEDIYDGIATSQGNPWILLTAGMAEHLYQVARDLQSQGRLTITDLNFEFYRGVLPVGDLKIGEQMTVTDLRFAQIQQGLRDKADLYLRRVQFQASPDGGFSEEIQRDTGAPRGARDLTWNYAAIITALNLR
jgi:glucoamylase